MSTKTRNILIGVVGVLLLVGIVFGCIAFFGGDKITDRKTQYAEFTNRTVFPQGTSMLSDDGFITLNGGIENKVSIVVEAPATGLYKIYFNNYALTMNDYSYYYVTSSAWNEGSTFVCNREDGTKYDAQGFSEHGVVLYLTEGRNVLNVWAMSGNKFQINDMKYKLHGFDTDILIQDFTFTDGYTGDAPNGPVTAGLEGPIVLRKNDKATGSFKVTDSGEYSVGSYLMFNDSDSTVSIKVYDDTGAVVGSLVTDELKDHLVIKRQHDGSSCCAFLDFDNYFKLELEVGTYTFEVTTENWCTFGGMILDRVGPLTDE